ncbi:hypothetical protein H0H92_010339 [Tricholoma furcatifolium]|nr:hypothetical protein H0H92_010339 [Tricholoma furcatifolium]
MTTRSRSALLPRSANVDFKAWVKNVADFEPLVNSLWLSIIHQHFGDEIKSLDYSAHPELRAKRGNGFCDLALVRNGFPGGSNVTVDWQIIVEGKRTSGSNWNNTLAQLIGYANDQLSTQHGWCYLIAAIGEECRFWIYERWNINPVYHMKVEFNAQTQRKEVQIRQNPPEGTGHTYVFHLPDMEDQKDIVFMLEYIKANGPIGGQRRNQ